MEIANYFYFVVSLFALGMGADLLVKNASDLARGFGVSKLIVGLTIVAFGTSAPELAVSLQAAIMEKSDLSIGNVVGSNLFNILVILGLFSLFAPIGTGQKGLKFDLIFLSIISVVFYITASDLMVSNYEAILFIAMLIWYLYKIIKREKDEKADPIIRSDRFKNTLLAVVGIAILATGADLMVFSASNIARDFGVSELFIAIAVVSVGTSLPEFVISLIAIIKKESEIAIGNVIGSNIFNTLLIVGVSALFSPTNLQINSLVFSVDLPFLVIVTTALFLLLNYGKKINKPTATVFLMLYLLYILYQFLVS